MLAFLVRLAVRRAGTVVALALAVLIYGGLRLQDAGLDIFPEFAAPRVVIQTEAPGLTAEQTETLVTLPIEKQLAGLIGLDTIRSESIQGLSVVTVVFHDGADIHRCRQSIGERLTGLATQLPGGTGPPVMVPLSSSSATVLTLGLEAQSGDSLALREFVDWTLAPRLMAVPGVADVNVFGGALRQLQIQVLPERLRHFGLTLDDVVRAAREATGLPGAGFLENENQRIGLRLAGLPSDVDSLRRVVLQRRDGGNVSLGDVARIAVDQKPPIGAAAIGNRVGIVLMVIGQYGANTLTVSRQLEAVLDAFKPVLEREKLVLHPHLFRPADYIERSLENLSGHLLAGAALVLVILLVFLFNLRSALISAAAIPASLVAAATALLAFNVHLNIMVLGGLTIALGEVADDAIIDTENIFRRLRENRLLQAPRPALQVVFRASLEVRGSVVYASFIVALVFLPLLTLGGVAGRLFAPLGVAYILAILMSLLVAVTLTPALCKLLLGSERLAAGEPPVMRLLAPVYRRLLGAVLDHPGIALSATLAAGMAAALAVPGLAGQFLPELREGHFIVHTTSLPGTSLNESMRLGGRLVEQFLSIPGVESASQWAGRAERGADTYGSHYSEYEVRLKPLPGAGQQAVLDRLRADLRDMPGIVFEANTFLMERIAETISGNTAALAINLYGKDLDELDQSAEQVAAVLRRLPGATDVQVRSPAGTPLLQVQFDTTRLAAAGLRPLQAADALQTALQGREVGSYFRDNRAYPVSVVLPPELRREVDSVAAIPLRTPDGAAIRLDAVASIEQVEGRYNILHRAGQRVQTVTANFAGRDLVNFMDDLKTRLAREVSFPADVMAEFAGAAVERQKARADLFLHASLAGLGVLLLTQMALGSLRHTLLTLSNLPFCLTGGVGAALLTGGTVSLGSLVGFVTLFGITLRNSIMLVSHYRHLVEREGLTWNRETVLLGASQRLPSILMTALVTALAMLPIAVNSDNPGREIMGPMAAVIVGGLTTSTLLNLLVLPYILFTFGRFSSARLAGKESAQR